MRQAKAGKGPAFGDEAIRALVVAALGYAATFAAGVVSARTLGPEGKGVLTLFLTTVAGLSAVSSLGAGQGQIYHAAKAPEKLRFFMPHAALLSLILGGSAAGLYLLLGGHLGKSTVAAQLGWRGFLVVLVAVPVWSFVTFQRQLLLTVGRYTLAKAVGALTAASPLVAIAASYLIYGTITVRSVVFLLVAMQGLIAVAVQPTLRAPLIPDRVISVPYLKESLAFGIRQWASEVTQFLASRIDFFIVASILGGTALGIYSVAVGIAEIVSRLAYELGTMLFPAIAADSLRPGQAPAVLRTTVAAAVGLAVVFGGFAGPLIAWLYGPAFAEAVGVLQVLLIGTVAWSVAQILWLYGSGAGRLEFVLVVLAASAALDIGLNFILLPRFGVLGAGLSATMSYLLAAAALLPLFCRRERCSLSEATVVTKGDLRRVAELVSQLPSRLRIWAGSQEPT